MPTPDQFTSFDANMMTTCSATVTTSSSRFEDPIVEDFIEWVREVPLESDAVWNIPRILRAYDKTKSLWQRLKCLFL